MKCTLNFLQPWQDVAQQIYNKNCNEFEKSAKFWDLKQTFITNNLIENVKES